ncbi:MAG: PaaI family thioesterase [Chloroflexota bacterium]
MTCAIEAPTPNLARRKQPNSRHCFVCGVENRNGLGLRFYHTGPGEVTAETTVPEHFQGYPGVVHGGVVATMLDEIVGRAAMEGEPTRFMVTASLKVRYHQPVPIGQPLRLVGTLKSRRGRLATAVGQLHLPDGSLGAEAEALLSDLPTMPGGEADLEALGWKVYPD